MILRSRMILMKSVANKANNKIYIIQNVAENTPGNHCQK